jgi:hypothetical protein
MYGRLGQPAMKLLHLLGDEAPGPGGVTRASLVNGALQELSVDLCRGNFFAYRASVGMLARSSGTSFRAGMHVPTDECVEQCCVVCACDVLPACPVYVAFCARCCECTCWVLLNE